MQSEAKEELQARSGDVKSNDELVSWRSII